MGHAGFFGKREGSKKRERPNGRWVDSMKGMSLQELGRARRMGHGDITHSQYRQESELARGHVIHMDIKGRETLVVCGGVISPFSH